MIYSINISVMIISIKNIYKLYIFLHIHIKTKIIERGEIELWYSLW